MKIDLRVERLADGGFYVWHDWRKRDPVVGPLRNGQRVVFPDGRVMFRQGEKRVKWYIPVTWVEQVAGARKGEISAAFVDGASGALLVALGGCLASEGLGGR